MDRAGFSYYIYFFRVIISTTGRRQVIFDAFGYNPEHRDDHNVAHMSPNSFRLFTGYFATGLSNPSCEIIVINDHPRATINEVEKLGKRSNTLYNLEDYPEL